MKRTALFFTILLFLFSCKKNSSSADKPTSDSTIKLGDLKDASPGINIPIYQNGDSIFFQPYARTMTPPRYELDVPPPQQRPQLWQNCTGWAVCYGLLGFFYKTIEGNTSYSLTNSFSPIFVWNKVNGHVDRAVPTADVMYKVWKDGGCSKYPLMEEDLGAAAIPSPAAVSNASEFVFSRVNEISLVQFNEQFAAALISNGYPIVFSAAVDKQFYDASGSNWALESESRKVYKRYLSADSLGRHAMLICGYDNGIKAYKVLNSWGTGKGNSGYYWVDYDVIKSMNPKFFIAAPGTVYTRHLKDTTSNGISLTGYLFPNGSTVTEKGFCWSTHANSTTKDNKKPVDALTRSFTTAVTNLQSNTNFFIRAYAIYSNGTVLYGNERPFKTKDGTVPTVTTTSPTSITSTTASSGGKITNDGGASITARGICWSTSQNPTIANSKTLDGSGSGSFTSNITGLTNNTTYHLRAYATNSAGTAYGNEVNLKTTSQSCYTQDTLQMLSGDGVGPNGIHGRTWIVVGLALQKPDGTNIAVCQSITYVSSDTAKVTFEYDSTFNNVQLWGKFHIDGGINAQCSYGPITNGTTNFLTCIQNGFITGYFDSKIISLSAGSLEFSMGDGSNAQNRWVYKCVPYKDYHL